MLILMLIGLTGQCREGTMGLCNHLCDAEEQMRGLLSMINEHLKLHDTEEDAYGSLLAAALARTGATVRHSLFFDTLHR